MSLGISNALKSAPSNPSIPSLFGIVSLASFVSSPKDVACGSGGGVINISPSSSCTFSDKSGKSVSLKCT